MAVTIKLKNASGSDPSASDLVVGEVALRTDTAKLFTKKDDNSVAEIGANVSADSVDSNAIQDDAVTADKLAANAVVTGSIVDDAVTFVKQQNISTSRVLGRVSSSTGNIEELTAANIRTLINVADGATNVTNTNQLTNGAGFLTSVGTSDIDNDAVTYSKIQNVSATNRILGRDSSGAGDIEEITPANVRTMLGLASSATTDTTNASNISSGTLAAARVATLNQDTTGNAATATALETARTIAGVSFDGTSNISLNNNAITNGAGYITSADGGNAATLDSIDSSQFLRSDTADTATGVLTINGGLAFGSSATCEAAIQALTDGSTITINFASGIHYSVTLGGNRTLGNPQNITSSLGQSGSIFITQDGTGGRTLAFHGDYKFAGGTAPTLSTAAGAVDRIDYILKEANTVHCAVSLDVK